MMSDMFAAKNKSNLFLVYFSIFLSFFNQRPRLATGTGNETCYWNGVSGWRLQGKETNRINCVCKDHRDKIKVPDPVVKDLISKKL